MPSVSSATVDAAFRKIKLGNLNWIRISVSDGGDMHTGLRHWKATEVRPTGQAADGVGPLTCSLTLDAKSCESCVTSIIVRSVTLSVVYIPLTNKVRLLHRRMPMRPHYPRSDGLSCHGMHHCTDRCFSASTEGIIQACCNDEALLHLVESVVQLIHQHIVLL